MPASMAPPGPEESSAAAQVIQPHALESEDQAQITPDPARWVTRTDRIA